MKQTIPADINKALNALLLEVDESIVEHLRQTIGVHFPTNKSDLQVFVDMNVDDIKNGTANLGISPHFISGNIRGKNGYIEMGVEPDVIHKMLNDEAMAVLVVLDQKTYRKFKAK